MTPEDKLAQMGIILPTESPARTVASAANVGAHVATAIQQTRSGLVWTNQVPSVGTAGKYLGRLGANLSTEEGYQAARLCAINAVGELNLFLGDLSRVRQFVNMLCFVVCTPDFQQISLVANGASDFFVEVFGDRGHHARGVMGVQRLAGDYSVEISLCVDASFSASVLDALTPAT